MTPILHMGDCLDVMASIRANSIDLIACDLPYGLTANRWDSMIPLNLLWAQYERILTPAGCILLTASQPFTSQLVMSNSEWFRYDWIWQKEKGSNFQHARHQPMKVHESVLVFARGRTTYNPQFWYSKPYKRKAAARNKKTSGLRISSAASYHPGTDASDGRRFPISILKVGRDRPWVHPAQKPVSLMEFLIRTYSDEGDVVLDNCMGSGSTGVACLNTNRRFIGIERERKDFEIAKRRIEEAGAGKKEQAA